MQVFEDQHRDVLGGKALEEESPCGVEVAWIGGRAFLEPHEVGESGLDPAALLGIGNELLHGLAELGPRRLGSFVLDDAGTHPHHLVEGPVRNALAVSKTAASVPPDRLGDAVEVLEEFPGQTRLPDAGNTDDRHQTRGALFARAVQQLLEEAELAITPDKRRLETRRPQRTSGGRHHPLGAPQTQRLGLAFELMLARVRIDDCRLAGDPCRVADVDGPRHGGRLDPRCRVDQVSGDAALAAHPERHGGLAGQHSSAGAKPRRTDLVAEDSDRIDEVEGGPHRAFRVVLLY